MNISMFLTGCKTSGVYGTNCEEQCPTNCRDNICDIQNGACFGCESGWTGTTCNARMIKITNKLCVAIS